VSTVPSPLTPALSLWERENDGSVWEQPERVCRLDSSSRLRRAADELPLPKGEGGVRGKSVPGFDLRSKPDLRSAGTRINLDILTRNLYTISVINIHHISAEEIKKAAKAISPLHRVGKPMIPFLLIHGDADKLVPLSHSGKLVAAIKAAGGSGRANRQGPVVAIRGSPCPRK